MKKQICLALSLSFFLLSSCSTGEAADGAEFQIPDNSWMTENITSMALIDDNIAAIAAGKLIGYDGSQEKQIEIELESPEHIAADDEYLYICDTGLNQILTVDYDRETVAGRTDFDFSPYSISDFAVTEHYFVFLGLHQDSNVLVMADRNDAAVTQKKVSFDVSCIASYREDKIWLHQGSDSTIDSKFRVYSITDDNFERNWQSDTTYVYDCVYNEALDSLIFIGDSRKVSLLGVQDSLVRTISYEGGSSSGMVTEQNVLAWAMEDGVHFYDLRELENAVTIATYAFPSIAVTSLIEKYAHETAVVLQEINIDDKQTIDLLLLSGDTRYDLFLMPSHMYFANYVRNQEYGDLAAYEGMTELAADSGVASICMQDGKMFGVPVDIAAVNNRNYKADESLAMTLNLHQYMETYIDLTVPAYYDEDGSALKEVLEYIRDYDLAAAEYPVLYKGDNTMVECSYLMLNRASERKEDAVKFLRYVMEYHADKGNSEQQKLRFTWYSDLTITEEATPMWKFDTTEIRLALLDAARNVIAGASAEEEAKTAWHTVRFMVLE